MFYSFFFTKNKIFCQISTLIPDSLKVDKLTKLSEKSSYLKFNETFFQECVHWDIQSHRWSGAGSWLVQSNASHSVCHFTYLSTYAVIRSRVSLWGSHDHIVTLDPDGCHQAPRQTLLSSTPWMLIMDTATRSVSPRGWHSPCLWCC